jgi:hypothetical protein
VIVPEVGAVAVSHGVSMGVSHAVTTILPTLMAGWIMVWAGLKKRRLEHRPQECTRCHRRSCTCASRH